MSGHERHQVAILGGGSAAETLAGALNARGISVIVFERARVGGECPYVACIPSKSLLHDAAIARPWDRAVARRDDIVHHLDDGTHADELTEQGITLVRADARIAAGPTVSADGRTHDVDHIVIATGATPLTLDIEGLTEVSDLTWSSEDALTTSEQPERIAIVGGGPIGCELAQIFAGFGTEVHLVDVADRAFPDLPDPIASIVDDGLRDVGVRIARGRKIERIERRGAHAVCHLDDGTAIGVDRIVVAAGRRARTDDLGLEHLGLDPTEPLPVGTDGRLRCPGSVWAVGDVAGLGEYTHLANHQARVVADHLAGDGARSFRDAVLPACIFTDPPVMMVGPRPAEIDHDVVWVEARMSDVARWTTDELGDGYLTIAVRRDTRTIVAAHGAGARFDELAASFVIAIDGAVPVDVLVRSMFPFPTVSELIGLVVRRAVDALDDVA